ncbi:MAG: penicillin acylase family protein [Bacteroidota bacterium]
MKRQSVIYLLVIICLQSFAADFTPAEIAAWKKQASSVTIIRDRYGVPHIYGNTDADSVFGMLYAQCEDGFERVEMNYLTALGRVAEVKGEAWIWQDLRARMVLDADKAREQYRTAPANLKKLLDAFAAGINYFLHTHPQVKPRLLTRFEPWMHLLFSEGSIGGDIASISLQDLRKFYEQGGTRSIADDLKHEQQGSNGFAIAPSKSTTGNALFWINPHTTFYFRSELHMVSKEGLSAYGAATWGQLFLYQGFNANCGWMHTSSSADVIDRYRETISRKPEGLFYQYDGQDRRVEQKKHVIKVQRNGTPGEVSFTSYQTHHGPVIAGEGNQWITIRMMDDPVNALMQSFYRTKATGYESFKKTMAYRTNSSNNTVYADNQGNIAYWHGNFMPKRDQSIEWSGTVDGTTSATEWRGLHEHTETVHILNPSTGWIQNCNSNPFTASGTSSPDPAAYPRYMAPDSENFRGLHAIRVIGRDGKFSTETLRDAAFDPWMPGLERLMPAVVNAWKDNADILDPALRGPATILSNWDFRTSRESVGMTLAMVTGRKMLEMTYARFPGRPMDNIGVVEVMVNELSATDRIKCLRLAVNELMNTFGKWEVPWGDLNRYQRPAGLDNIFDDRAPSLAVGLGSGTWGALASYESKSFQTGKWYGTSGNSFVAVVDFGKKIKAKSILIGGQNCDPASPNFTDQAEGYINGAFKDVLFYRSEVDKAAVRRYRPGN